MSRRIKLKVMSLEQHSTLMQWTSRGSFEQTSNCKSIPVWLTKTCKERENWFLAKRTDRFSTISHVANILFFLFKFCIKKYFVQLALLLILRKNKAVKKYKSIYSQTLKVRSSGMQFCGSGSAVIRIILGSLIRIWIKVKVGSGLALKSKLRSCGGSKWSYGGPWTLTVEAQN